MVLPNEKVLAVSDVMNGFANRIKSKDFIASAIVNICDTNGAIRCIVRDKKQ